MVKTIHIGDIATDPVARSRVSLNTEVARNYSEAMRRGEEFPPITIHFDGTKYWLSDGAHRLAARKLNQETEIEAEVRSGTQLDAQWAAFTANTTHGLPRTTADKHKVITEALKHPHGAEMSNNQLAQHCGVDPKTVAVIRRELEATKEIPQSRQRIGKDGRVYDTAKITEARNVQAKSTMEIPYSDLNESLVQFAQNILGTGHRLQEVRELLSDEQWRMWLKSEVELDVLVADRYLTIANKYGEAELSVAVAGRIADAFAEGPN